jgi:aspartyl-tRNA(Asn)/glutamyl-tRNA(Gln) amidotransferase subunit C
VITEPSWFTDCQLPVLEGVMKLSKKQVHHIAELARLALSDREEALYQEQLSAILQHFERLQELDTEAIPPTATVLPLRNVMRADEPSPSSLQEGILANAPATDEGCFKVPAVME